MAGTHDDDDLAVHRGSGDFLADQGVQDPDEFRVKTHLCHAIATIIETRSLTHALVAELTGWPQTDIARIINSRHNGYSVWLLIKALAALGADVGIVINPDTDNDRGIILTQTLEADDGGDGFDKMTP